MFNKAGPQEVMSFILNVSFRYFFSEIEIFRKNLLSNWWKSVRNVFRQPPTHNLGVTVRVILTY